jgi:hypothetical protein
MQGVILDAGISSAWHEILAARAGPQLKIDRLFAMAAGPVPCIPFPSETSARPIRNYVLI